ncbi:MAG: hypothetical protein AAGU21_17965 [Solidesulfovibrio sp.]|uniref:hypothetical protein n=1 Tax=Solidesulfovibrio sp. TaxID=2910990 RepID=UPI00315805CA
MVSSKSKISFWVIIIACVFIVVAAFPNGMKTLIEFAKLIVALAWPVAFCFAVYFFKDELKAFINKVEFFKGPGFEVRMSNAENKIANLENDVRDVVAKVDSIHLGLSAHPVTVKTEVNAEVAAATMGLKVNPVTVKIENGKDYSQAGETDTVKK